MGGLSKFSIIKGQHYTGTFFPVVIAHRNNTARHATIGRGVPSETMTSITIDQIRDSSFIVEFNTTFNQDHNYRARVIRIENEKFLIEGPSCPASGHIIHFRIFDMSVADETLLKGRARIDDVKQPNRASPTLHMTLTIVQTEQTRLSEFMNLFQERQDISSFVKSLKVGVISTSNKTQMDVMNGLHQCGLTQIKTFTDTTTAFEEFQKERMDCVLAEWDLEDSQRGMELLKQIRATKQGQGTIAMIISSEVDKNRIAQSIDGDIDEFVAKPFSPASLHRSFWDGLKRRKFPSPYTLSLRQISQLIDAKNFSEALNHITVARSQHDTPTTALYYQGYIAMIMGQIDEALKLYDSGLELNAHHLKCLFGKAFLLKREQRMDQYYSVLKHILDVYPEHANSIRDGLPLSLIYNDLQFAAGLLIRIAKNQERFTNLQPIVKQFGSLLLQKLQEPGADGSLRSAVQTVMKKLNHEKN